MPSSERNLLHDESDLDMMRRHIAGMHDEPLCDQNGLITYAYNDAVQEDGYFSPTAMNIGDYIQSLAARQFLPRVDECIDRDRLAFYDGRPVNMIMNAWYHIWKGNEVFSDRIRPLMTSIHLSNTHAIADRTLDYFKKHEPIGCRDFSTRDFLQSNGIRAYFSGCMTLTLGETFKRKEARNMLYFVGYRMGGRDQRQTDREIRKIIRMYKPCAIRSLNHTAFPITRDVGQPMAQAAKLLDMYAGARLVVAHSLHCALPCLAMNVPVVLVNPRYDGARYGGLASFLNYIGENEAGEFVTDIKLDESGFICNPDRHKPHADMLKRLCHAFMQNDSVTTHHGESDLSCVIDEESELCTRYAVARKIRNFFYKETIRKNRRWMRICKVFHFARKS